MRENVHAVDQNIPYGVYVWRINGKAIVNENLEYLQIASRRGDITKIHALQEYVNKELGIFEGGPTFEEGSRPISQAEWEDQMARQRAGEVPDPYDLGNLIEEAKYAKEVDSS
jgi:hypothetical protein